MDPVFIEDLASLCHTPVSSFEEAKSVLSLLSELITGDIHTLSEEDRRICWLSVINSQAYQWSRTDTQNWLLQWLVDVDKLQTELLYYIGNLVYWDHAELGSNSVRVQQSAVQAVVDAVWMYRYTNQAMVALYLKLLFLICLQSEISTDVLEQSITDSFIRFLYEEIRDHNVESARDMILVILGLNDQFMLHDKRGKENRVFAIFEESPNHFVTIAGALVWLFNRFREQEQDLKIFVCKFLYLMFTTPNTEDLLYTNDLIVLVEILVRELHDLPVDAVEVGAMYLRVLHAIIKVGSTAEKLTRLREQLIDVCQLTIDSAESLDTNNRQEIHRLASRCLSVPWLQDTADSEEDSLPEVYEPSAVGLKPNYHMSDSSVDADFTPHVTVVEVATPPSRSAPPPPPHRQVRNASVASNMSSDSKHSMAVVGHFRPPPPPPPPPPRGRKVGRK